MICQASADRAPSRRTTEAAAAPSAVTASATGVGWGRSGSNLGSNLTASLVAIILTASDSEADVMRSYDLNAAGYVTKPVDPENFVRTVLGIEGYWLCVVRRPSG